MILEILERSPAQEKAVEKVDETEETVKEDAEGGVQEKTQKSQRRRGLMELLVMCAPFYHVFCILYVGFYYLNMDMPILLISLFPAKSRNILTIVLCISFEMLILSVALSWVVDVIFIVVSFIHTFKDSIDLVIWRISR